MITRILAYFGYYKECPCCGHRWTVQSDTMMMCSGYESES